MGPKINLGKGFSKKLRIVLWYWILGITSHQVFYKNNIVQIKSFTQMTTSLLKNKKYVFGNSVDRAIIEVLAKVSSIPVKMNCEFNYKPFIFKV